MTDRKKELAAIAGVLALISADESVPIGRGLALLGEMREASITEVAFQTKLPPQKEPDL